VTQQFEAPHPNGAVTVRTSPPSPRRRRRRQVFLALLVAVGLAWGYAIWYSVSQRSPERLDDSARAAVADACSTAKNALERLPDLGEGATAATDVSLVREENEVLTRMTDRIDSVSTEGGDPQAALDGWAADWRDLIRARATFASDLEADGTARLSIPTVSQGGLKPITDRMDLYATQRGLDGCRPGELQAEVVDGPRDYRNGTG
jgi:hypothetical protein